MSWGRVFFPLMVLACIAYGILVLAVGGGWWSTPFWLFAVFYLWFTVTAWEDM